MDLEQEISQILDRNKRVEADKRWETSLFRRLCIAAMTYVVAVAWLFTIRESAAWAKALVPVAGYLLSTLSLPPIKKWWIYKNFK